MKKSFTVNILQMLNVLSNYNCGHTKFILGRDKFLIISLNKIGKT